jgi:hypothetical protein
MRVNFSAAAVELRNIGVKKIISELHTLTVSSIFGDPVAMPIES